MAGGSGNVPNAPHMSSQFARIYFLVGGCFWHGRIWCTSSVWYRKRIGGLHVLLLGGHFNYNMQPKHLKHTHLSRCERSFGCGMGNG